jgi:hypothetical protein
MRYLPGINGNKTAGTRHEKTAYQPLTTESMLAPTYPHPLAVLRISFYSSGHIERRQHYFPLGRVLRWRRPVFALAATRLLWRSKVENSLADV